MLHVYACRCLGRTELNLAYTAVNRNSVASRILAFNKGMISLNLGGLSLLGMPRGDYGSPILLGLVVCALSVGSCTLLC